MSTWEHSKEDTRQLRANPEAGELAPEATVYRKDDLFAVIFCEEIVDEQHDTMCWHMYVAGRTRKPTHAEVNEARLMLLPNIINYTITSTDWQVPNSVHVEELPTP